MVKILLVANCDCCPSCGTNRKAEPACKQVNVRCGWGRTLNKSLAIPSWCPLPDIGEVLVADNEGVIKVK